MKVSQLTSSLAKNISSGGYVEFMDFEKNHEYFHHIIFTHANFYYSYPKLGKNWPKDQGEYCFHKITTVCHECGKEPERNYAGIGSIYMTGFAPRISGRFTLYCENCVPGRMYKRMRSGQLTLF